MGCKNRAEFPQWADFWSSRSEGHLNRKGDVVGKRENGRGREKMKYQFKLRG